MTVLVGLAFFLLLCFSDSSDTFFGWFGVLFYVIVCLVVVPIAFVILSYRIILASGIFAAYETGKDTLALKINDHVTERVETLGLSQAAFVQDGLNLKETILIISDGLIDALPDGIEKHVKKMFDKLPIDQIATSVASNNFVTDNLGLGDRIFNQIDNKVQFFLKPNFKWNYLLLLFNIGFGLLIIYL